METPGAIDFIGKVEDDRPGAEPGTGSDRAPAPPPATPAAGRGGGRAETAPATPVAKEKPPVAPGAPRPAPADEPGLPVPPSPSTPPRQIWINDPIPRQPRPQPGQNGVTLIPGDGGEQVGTLPLPPLPGDDRPPGNGGRDPYDVAIDILARVPLPDIKIRMNPGIGLVALPSWYWIEGYDGSPFGESRTIDIPPEVSAQVPFTEVPEDDPRRQGRSFTVEVRVQGSRYDWSFGDGAGLTTGSLGKPYPVESDLQHTYEHSSLRHAEGFPIRVTAEYSAAFRVDGGAWQGLRTVRRTYGTAHRVQEIQTVLVGGR